MTESVYEYQYVFPAVRGIQAKVNISPVWFHSSLSPKSFLFDGDDVPPELESSTAT